jgi:hypothetical protein
MRGSQIEAGDAYFWRLDRPCVPWNPKLRLKLIYELYDSRSARQRGLICTLAKALDRLWWQRTRQDVKDIYDRCVVCLGAKIQL